MSLEFVIVRSINESKRMRPKTFLPREQAEELYQAGLALWNKKRTALTLKKVDHEMWKPAPSLIPNERIMNDFVEGKMYAIRIVEKWAFAA